MVRQFIPKNIWKKKPHVGRQRIYKENIKSLKKEPVHPLFHPRAGT
jgi:hypothetical protein